jgi:hypothetical protein
VWVQTVLGEVIGEVEENVPQDEVLVVSKVVGVVDKGLVWVVVSVGTVKDVGVDVEGGLVVGEVGPVVVFEEVGMPVRRVPCGLMALIISGTTELYLQAPPL